MYFSGAICTLGNRVQSNVSHNNHMHRSAPLDVGARANQLPLICKASKLSEDALTFFDYSYCSLSLQRVMIYATKSVL